VLNKHLYTLCLCLFSVCLLFSQKEKDSANIGLDKDLVQINQSIVETTPIDPLSPSRAAFYSAILPGLGQAYNKKYWKIPIVYAALGTGIYFYTTNNKEYKRYRDAYKRRLAGFEDDEFYNKVTLDGLQRAQRFYRKNKEVSLLVTIGIYALNIIDANVDAHLLQYNVNENLTLAPHFKINELDAKSDVGLTLNFKF